MNIKENVNGPITRLTLAGSVLLVICHALQYHASGFYYKPLVYGALSLAYIVLTVFTGRRFLPQFLFTAGMVYLFCIRFDNYTPFLLVLIACYIQPQYIPVYSGAYIGGTVFQFFRYRDGFTFVFIHYITCSFMFLALLALRKREQQREPLSLTPAEEDILQQITSGVEIKAVTGYSENTVYKKLREARERNSLANNTELITRYKRQQ